MEEIEIPQFFLCPISLQIMKDPVTTATGITYDRDSIEHWLKTAKEAACPVTKQPLPWDSDLTPNHMLRRLIQGWCTTNAKYGVDRIPTPKSPLSKAHVLKLIRNLNVRDLYNHALKKMNELANENEKNRKCMMESGVAKAMILLIIKCSKERKTNGLEEALGLLNLIWSPINENVALVEEKYDLIIQSLMWILQRKVENCVLIRTQALRILKIITDVARPIHLEQIHDDLLMEFMNVLRCNLSQQAVKAVLHVLIQICPWGGNRIKIIEAGAVFDLIELELCNNDKKMSELLVCLLADLCSCADGRAQLLKHAGAIAMISKRILRISPATDDRSVHILALVTKFSATNQVLLEMLRVGAVSKLCMVLQADSEPNLKKKAREILRQHSNVWSNSPCIQVYLLTRCPR